MVGLYSTWDEILPQAPPVMVKAVLLPFGDRIIHDGLVAAHNVYLGPGIRRDYREMVRDLKAQGGPTLSLLPGTPSRNGTPDRARQPDVQPRGSQPSRMVGRR